jgi:hypothetical protein
LSTIHHAAITGIFSFFDFKNSTTCGTEFSNLLSSLSTLSKFFAQRCPHAVEGSSNIIASGNFLYFSSRFLISIFTHLSVDNIGINTTLG